MPSSRASLIDRLRESSASMRSAKAHGAASVMDVDLSVAQLKVILLLAESGAMPMSPMASELGVTLSACSHLVDKLMGTGYVTRSTSPDDRRVVRCTVTEKGQALAERIRQSMPFERPEFLDRLTLAELRIIVQSMTIFLARDGRATGGIRGVAVKDRIAPGGLPGRGT